MPTLVEQGAEILGIGGLLNRKPEQLSGGQRQRVALGRAIVREPKVCLMEEPLSNLDAKLRVPTRAEISKLHQRLETTFIYVTHNRTEAMTMGTCIAVMRDGILQQLDTLQHLYDYPVNTFVAGFIGSPALNYFDATVTGNGEDVRLDTGTFKLSELADVRGKMKESAGNLVMFGLRPEDIHKRDDVPGKIYDARVSATLDVMEPMDAEIYLYLPSSHFSSRMFCRHRFT